MQKVTFPGIKDISVYAILDFFWRSIMRDDVNFRSSSLSFSFFLALFPSVIFFFTLIAYLPFQQDHDQILFFIEQTIPESAYLTIKATLEDILMRQRGDLLSFGFISALFFSTNGFHSLMDSLNLYSGQKETRTFVKQRMVAIFLSIIVSVLILFSVLVVTVGTILLSYLGKIHYFPHMIIPFLLSTFNYLVVGAIVLGVVGAIYFLAPVKSRKWKFLNPGATFATITILVTTGGFTYYVNHFNSYNKLYGSIGVLIVIMMLIYINLFILLLGYELNLAIDNARKEKGKARDRIIKFNRIIYLDASFEQKRSE